MNSSDATFDLTLKHPSRMIIYGPSGSGKSTFVEKLLIHMGELFDFYFDNVIYCSGQGFPQFNSINGIPILKVTDVNRDMIQKIDSKTRIKVIPLPLH